MTRRWRRWLAGAAALAGALAPFAGAPAQRAAPAAGVHDASRAPGAPGARGVIDVAELARVIADQEDHISAVELATWIRAGGRGLRILDVRSADEFRAFHIPGAEHVPLDQLAHARFAPDETVVLYSELGVHAGQAWVLLRALGHPRARFLRNGLHEWLDDVMSPTLAADAPAEARAAFAHVAELSRWFGGTPRARAAAGAAGTPELPLTRRRGC